MHNLPAAVNTPNARTDAPVAAAVCCAVPCRAPIPPAPAGTPRTGRVLLAARRHWSTRCCTPAASRESPCVACLTLCPSKAHTHSRWGPAWPCQQSGCFANTGWGLNPEPCWVAAAVRMRPWESQPLLSEAYALVCTEYMYHNMLKACCVPAIVFCHAFSAAL